MKYRKLTLTVCGNFRSFDFELNLKFVDNTIFFSKLDLWNVNINSARFKPKYIVVRPVTGYFWSGKLLINYFVWWAAGPTVRPGTPFFLLRSYHRYSLKINDKPLILFFAQLPQINKQLMTNL